MSKPTISVVLPTYNRAEIISIAIKSVLNQTYKNFELIVMDNASTDNTAAVVQSFKDKRIKYVKNRVNLGYPRNLKKGFELSKGTYIFTLSDDDIIVHTDSFATIVKEMDKSNAGFGEMGLMYYESDYNRPSFLDHVETKEFFVPPTADIILKTISWHFGFVSGQIFRRELIRQSDLINDVWWVYFKVIYRSILKRGCYYFGQHFIDARISSVGLISYVDSKQNRGFYMEKLFDIYKEFDKSETHLQTFIKNRLDIIIGTFPGIKYYTSNQNIRSIARDMIRIRPAYRTELRFWFYVVVAIVAPKAILNLLRLLRISQSRRSIQELVRKINLKSNLKKALT